mmetsp:Transcript_7834/g.16728  ORF Transcript_7834/g.16728 Transcript_7834/m.16728 type:complete len:82 (+) Transcript_7834:174-419(+)
MAANKTDQFPHQGAPPRANGTAINLLPTEFKSCLRFNPFSVQQGARESIDALDAISKEIKLVDAVIHSLHVLIDIRPRVRA